MPSSPTRARSSRACVVASSRGLGYLLQFAQSTYNASLSLALVVLIMLFVLVLFSASERLERHLLRWRHE